MPAASSRWLEVDAHPPHAQGAGVLRFGSVGAGMGVDGGKPTSRGLAACDVGGRSYGETTAVPQKGFSRDESLERVRAEPAGLPAGWQGKQGVAEGTGSWLLWA